MMKFLRKYTKHMLVVVTIGILVSWLLGSTLPALLSPDPGTLTVGQAFGARYLKGSLHHQSRRDA